MTVKLLPSKLLNLTVPPKGFMTIVSFTENFLLFWDREGNNLAGREVVFIHPFNFVILSQKKNNIENSNEKEGESCLKPVLIKRVDLQFIKVTYSYAL